MRLARTATALALLLSAFVPAAAGASDDPGFDQKVAALVAGSQKNFTVTHSTEGEAPYTIRMKDARRFEVSSVDGTERTLGSVKYVSLDSLYLARASLAKKGSLKWYADNQPGAAPAFEYAVGRFLVAARYGTVTRVAGGYLLKVEFSSDALTFEDLQAVGASSSAQYRVTLDSRGRIATVDGSYDEARFSSEPETYFDSYRFSYGTVNLSTPSRSSVTSLAGLDTLPALPPLDFAAITTAIDANRLAAVARKPMNTELITEAALTVDSPDGLVAVYLSNGLKYSIGDRSMCITVARDKKTAVAKRC
jgi:hypothetical protein